MKTVAFIGVLWFSASVTYAQTRSASATSIIESLSFSAQSGGLESLDKWLTVLRQQGLVESDGRWSTQRADGDVNVLAGANIARIGTSISFRPATLERVSDTMMGWLLGKAETVRLVGRRFVISLPEERSGDVLSRQQTTVDLDQHLLETSVNFRYTFP